VRVGFAGNTKQKENWLLDSVRSVCTVYNAYKFQGHFQVFMCDTGPIWTLLVYDDKALVVPANDSMLHIG